MRHGNLNMRYGDAPVSLNFDPTYEAWKLHVSPCCNISPFLHFDPTYEAWKHSELKSYMLKPMKWISILPMRHGNCSRGNLSNGNPSISILPMRHGNGPLIISGRRGMWHFDPTYEAWKPNRDSFCSEI